MATTTRSNNPKGKPPLSAPPPLSAIGVIVGVTIFSLWGMPSWDDIDAVATLAALTTPVLPSIFSTCAIGIIRCAIAAFILGAITIRMLGPGVEIFQTPNPTKSKLQPWKMRLSGWLILTPFTYWSFLLMGLYFLTAGILCLLVSFDVLEDGKKNFLNSVLIPGLLRFSLLAFEISAPGAFLVSTVVRYGLWPAGLKAKGPDGTILFRSFMGLVTHNANVVFVLVEICFLGGTPVLLEHLAVGPVMGILYIFFSWYMMHRWQPGHQTGPRFIYFFLDTTVPNYDCAVALVVLVTVLLGFYILVAQIDALLGSYLEADTLLPRILITIGLASAVCRFRD